MAGREAAADERDFEIRSNQAALEMRFNEMFHQREQATRLKDNELDGMIASVRAQESALDVRASALDTTEANLQTQRASVSNAMVTMLTAIDSTQLNQVLSHFTSQVAQPPVPTIPSESAT